MKLDGLTKASPEKLKARIAIVGPSGSGKTYSALAIAERLADGGGIIVIDTESRSASLYAGSVAEFYTIEDWVYPGTKKKLRIAMGDHSPEAFEEAIHAIDTHIGPAVIIIDSLSHAWIGAGGAMEIIDNSSGSSFNAWAKVTPLHRNMLTAIRGSLAHVIATMRVKTAYQVVERNGRSVPEKVGLAPVQRDGVEHEFDVIGEMDMEHVMHIGKSRYSSLDGKSFPKPGAEVADAITEATSSGEERPETRLRISLRDADNTPEALRAWINVNRVEHIEAMRVLFKTIEAKAADCGVSKNDFIAWIKGEEAPQAESETTKRIQSEQQTQAETGQEVAA